MLDWIPHILEDPWPLVHMIGVIIALGAVTATDGMMMFLRLRPSLSKSLARVAPLLSLMVWVGFVIIAISGIALVLRAPGIVHVPQFQFKVVLIAIVLVNGVFINVKITPLFQEFAEQWEWRNPRLTRFERISTVTGAISFVSWWLIFLIGWSFH